MVPDILHDICPTSEIILWQTKNTNMVGWCWVGRSVGGWKNYFLKKKYFLLSFYWRFRKWYFILIWRGSLRGRVRKKLFFEKKYFLFSFYWRIRKWYFILSWSGSLRGRGRKKIYFEWKKLFFILFLCMNSVCKYFLYKYMNLRTCLMKRC